MRHRDAGMSDVSRNGKRGPAVSAHRTHRSVGVCGSLAFILGGCSTTTEPDPSSSSGSPGSDPYDVPVELVADLDLTSIGLPLAASGSVPVNVGLFLYVRKDDTNPSWTEEEVADSIRVLMEGQCERRGANDIFAQCDMHLELEVAQVIALPHWALDLQGNLKGSWGGHPPEGTSNPALFNYNENERLTREARLLFSYGKKYTSPNTIAGP